MVAPAPAYEVGVVKVGRVKIESRACGAPDINYPWQRTTARVVTWNGIVAGEPGIHVHGNVVGRFSCRSNGMDEPCIVPGHEYLVGAFGVAEDFGPGSAYLVAVLIPQIAEPGIELVLVSLQVAREIGGNRRVEFAI